MTLASITGTITIANGNVDLKWGRPMINGQLHYERQRDENNRCPRCGSGNTTYAEDAFYDDEEHVWGTHCLECGYWHNDEGDPPVLPAFIMPGDSGSHDKLSDYPPSMEALEGAS